MKTMVLTREARRIKLRRYKKWFIMFWLFLIVLLVWSIATTVYFDPLCCTGMVNKNNRIFPMIDVRLQKTNMLIRCNCNYDALLIGSSRTGEFKQEDFSPYHVFNYSLPAIYPNEYEDYIALFQQYNKKTKVIFLGLDFYGTNLKRYRNAKPPSYYITTCKSYKPLQTFLNIDALKFSLEMAYGKREKLNYDRVTCDEQTKVIKRKDTEQLIERTSAVFASSFYGDYVYNPNYASFLQSLKKRYKNVRFVVFTTPVTTQLLKGLVSYGRMFDYERWLKDIVDVYGTAYNFMIPSPLTTNGNNFFDAHHMYPQKTTPVVRRIIGADDPMGPEICYLLKKETIKNDIKKIHKLFENCK